jgi:peptidoglycan/xylan/chitin deacetylase (PgdA/CDA1 family)
MKHLVERAVLASGLAALRRRRFAGRRLVLCYHNVVPLTRSGVGDSSLHLTLSRFTEHIDVAARIARLEGLVELMGGEPHRTCPRVAITFDDAYAGTIRYALPELARRGIPSTVFVPPAFMPGRSFWWDDLGRAGGLAVGDRATALEEFRGRDADVRRRFAGRLNALVEPPAELRCASLEQLGHAVAAGPVTLGSHTWSHPNLARATADELADELSRPLAWLRECFPTSALPAVSYPYGLRSPAVERAAHEAGYTMGFLVDGGWLPPRPDNAFALPRLNIPAGLSADGLALRLSGFFA